MINAFDEPALGELSACFNDRRVEWAKQTLEQRGWRFVESNPAPNYPGKTALLFHKTEFGQPIKSILHFLNRKLQLPVRKWEFSRAPKCDAEYAQTH
jgi:hypothetical protein